jgi:FAD/FMN-containing dehydrogenase
MSAAARRTALLNELGAIVGAEQVISDGADLLSYGADRTTRWPPAPLAAVLPASSAEVQAIVQLANRAGIALVPSGGRTGLSGGAVAARGELVIALDRMRRIGTVNTEDATLSCEAGAVTARIQAAAQAAGLYYPVDFASAGSSQIGGNIATNAGGIRVLRYGMTRDWVLGLTVVTGAGELLELGRGLVKDNSGYDLRQLFIGSEGTLGVICAATLRLAPPPPPTAVLVLGTPALAALPVVLAAFRRQCRLAACEFFSEAALARVVARQGLARPFAAATPCYTLIEVEVASDDDLEQALQVFDTLRAAGLVNDGVLAQSEAQTRDLWRLREDISDTLAPWQPHKNDIAVRPSRLPDFIARAEALFAAQFPALEVVWFGHLGDGNIHFNALKPAAWSGEEFQAQGAAISRALGALVQEFGGSISAEHGIGLLRKDLLHHSRSAEEIRLMRAVKAVFDPNHIMNPGKIFDPDLFRPGTGSP